MAGQFYFLVGAGGTPRATLAKFRPRTIQQPHTVQCDSSGDHNAQDYKHLFHGPAFYMNAVAG